MFCFEKGKDIFIVKNRKEGSSEIFKKSVKKEIYLTIKVITDITGVLCTKKR